MNVTCPGCGSVYFVDEKKVPSHGGRLTCRSCGLKWEIFRPETGRMPAVTAAKVAAAPPEIPPPGAVEVAEPAGPTTKKDRDGAIAAASEVTCPKCGHSFEPGAKPKAAPAASTQRKVILLVEDQKYFSELTREALGPDYRTVSVATKEEALKVMAAEAPSLLILDLSLARGQDGRDLLRIMPPKTFPVLIFTARDETELYGGAWEELKSLGADDIVHKGMNVGDELKRKVAALLGKK